MSKINMIKNLQIADTIKTKQSTPKNNEVGNLQERDFGATIKDFMQAVNAKSLQASREAADVIQGRSQNLHQAMAALEEARLSFQLMIEVRNKLLESYKELERMQV